MSRYNTFFSLVIPVDSSNGVDLDEGKMDEIVKEIEDTLKEKFPGLRVLPLGFELTKF